MVKFFLVSHKVKAENENILHRYKFSFKGSELCLLRKENDGFSDCTPQN